MTHSTNNQGVGPDAGRNGIRVLLLDTPENEGVDFLKSLQQQTTALALVSQRISGSRHLTQMLEAQTWDIVLVNDRVESPSTDEILATFRHTHSETGLVVLSSSTVTVDALADAYKRGVSELVTPEYPEYSLEVFSRAAERSRRNYQLSQLNQEKFELARHRDHLMSGTEEALAYLQDGIHVYANPA